MYTCAHIWNLPLPSNSSSAYEKGSRPEDSLRQHSFDTKDTEHNMSVSKKRKAQSIVKAAGNNSKDAVLLLIADKLPELVKTQAEAIKNMMSSR